MTILQITPRFWPEVGGVETHVEQLSLALIRQGHQVRIMAGRGPKSTKGEITHQGIAVTFLPLSLNQSHGWQHKLQMWRWWWLHRREVLSADTIQVHDVGWWLLPLWPWIARKWFITFHGWETVWPIPVSHKLHRFVISRLAKGRVQVGDWIREFYWDKPDVVTYGGVSLDMLPSVKVRLPTADQPWQVCFLGRLEPDNAIETYIELVEKWQTAGHRIHLTWVGDGSLRSRCETVGDVTGWVSDPTKYVAKAELVMASSYLSLLQAQAMGKPVVAAYDIPLKRRYLETYPGFKWMVVGRTGAELAEKVSAKLSDHVAWQADINAAAAWARTQTWDMLAQLYLKLWRTYAR